MIPILSSSQEHFEKIMALPRPGEENILAFYEQRLGFISKNPRLLLMPTDDHLAHRGDGVFETIKYQEGRLFNLDGHLNRMKNSAKGIYLEPPCPWEKIREIIFQTVKAGEKHIGMVRVLLGRGPGGFGIEPAECPKASLYVVAYRFDEPSEEWYQKGLKAVRTSIPPKQSYMVQIKSSNYLPNALMMYEAREKGAEVPFAFTEDDYLTESAIANICLVSQDNILEIPSLSKTLKGTTLTKAIKLLEGSMEHRVRAIKEVEIYDAKEVFILGTGPECAAVVEYEGKKIGNGKAGPVALKLRKLILDDHIAKGTPVPGL